MDDILLGIKSTALKFGNNTKYYLSGFGATMITSLLIAGMNVDQTLPYYAAVAVIAGHMANQVN